MTAALVRDFEMMSSAGAFARVFFLAAISSPILSLLSTLVLVSVSSVRISRIGTLETPIPPIADAPTSRRRTAIAASQGAEHRRIPRR
jgi:hypothetical protein